MQQTEFYYLNKIETDDPFSPNPLNQNAESVETADYLTGVAVRAEAQARDALDQRTTSLEQRVTALEVKKVVAGSYMGTGGGQIISLGFYPVVVIVCGYGNTRIATRERWNESVVVTEEGFSVRNVGAGAQFNMSANKYHYIAFG